MNGRIARAFMLLLLLFTWQVLVADEPRPSVAKKVIEWGWDEPDPKFVRDNIGAMEQYPFDGFVFHINSNKGGNFAWELWGNRPFEIAEFHEGIADLQATNFQRFTDRFLRVNITPGNVDWFDDAAWKIVQQNFAVAAQISQKSGCRGFMFDVEQYDGVELFNYQQLKTNGKSFTEFQVQVRERGQQWMRAVNEQHPDITVLLTFGYEIARWPDDRSPEQAQYGLLASFLDGCLDVAAADTTIVDAWEFSYPYKQEDQFRAAYDSIYKAALEWTGNPDKYRQHMRAGFGIWMDHRRGGWNLIDHSQNHFRPEEFEAAVRAALKTSDQYVWIYTERPRWWTGVDLPPPYVQALANARDEKARP